MVYDLQKGSMWKRDMLPFEDTEKEKLYLRREQFYAEEEHIPRKTY